MNKVIRTERGWPAHYCGSARCMFRRNTLLELGEIRVVVSTIGMQRSARTGEIEEIGVNRHYETLAFYAELQDQYWEIDTDRQIEFNSPWRIELDLKNIPAGISNTANEMHETVVAELTAKLEQGEL